MFVFFSCPSFLSFLKKIQCYTGMNGPEGVAACESVSVLQQYLQYKIQFSESITLSLCFSWNIRRLANNRKHLNSVKNLPLRDPASIDHTMNS